MERLARIAEQARLAEQTRAAAIEYPITPSAAQPSQLFLI
jgi:hypothetical protein